MVDDIISVPEVGENSVKWIAVAFVVVVFSTVAYTLFFTAKNSLAIDLVVIFIGGVLGVGGALYFLGNITDNTMEILFKPGEEVIFNSIQYGKQTYIIFPKEKDGFKGEDEPLAATLYLTSQGICAELH